MRSTSDKAIDTDALDALHIILCEDFHEVIDSFLRNAQRSISEIGTGITEGDRASIILSAHKLASSASQVGLTKLSELAHEIEGQAGHAPRMELEIILADADKAFAEGRDVLLNRCAKRDH
jgi:HPt (histidine-containing phosphotransfer) domain-containing protein